MQPRIAIDGNVVTLIWPTVPATVRMSKRDAIRFVQYLTLELAVSENALDCAQKAVEESYSAAWQSAQEVLR